MRLGLSSAFLLFLLWAAAASAADDDTPKTDSPESQRQIDAALVKSLSDWVAAAMQLKPAQRPLVVIANTEKYLQALRVGGSRNRETRFIQLPGTMIFDTDAVDTDNPIIKSQIVHGLVHYYQLLNKRDAPCVELREFEAFTLQNRWLEEQGERGFISPVTLARWEQCPPAEPPADTTAAAPEAALAEAPAADQASETTSAPTEE